MRHLPTATRTGALVACTLAILFGAMAGGASAAEPAPPHSAWWSLDSSLAPSRLLPGKEALLIVNATDQGYSQISGASRRLTIRDQLPAGVTLKHIFSAVSGPFNTGVGQSPKPLKCIETEGEQTVTCEGDGLLYPTESIRMRLEVQVSPSVEPGATLTNSVQVEGGAIPGGEEVPANSISRPVTVASEPEEPTPFGIENYELRPEDDQGRLETQAGSHPFQLTSSFDLNKKVEVQGGVITKKTALPASLPKTLNFVLPPGLIGNVQGMPTCSEAQFASYGYFNTNLCPPDTAVGYALVTLQEPTIIGLSTIPVPIFNMPPAKGEPARFGFEAFKTPVVLTTSVRTGSDYAVQVTSHYIPEVTAVMGSQVTFWGVPGDPRHDAERGWPCLAGAFFLAGQEPHVPCEPLGAAHPATLLTLPGTCESPAVSTVGGESWKGEQLAGAAATFTFSSPFSGCEQLPFHPAISVEADNSSAASPSGMTVHIHVPQESAQTPTGESVSESTLKGTVLRLPVGVVASAGATNGLGTCDATQVGFGGPPEEVAGQLANDHFSPDVASCPASSKVGTVSIHTPLLEHELLGGIYLGRIDTAPFSATAAAPLVLYIAAEDKASGVRVKLAGSVTIDETTGQLISSFTGTPPLPFEDLTVHLFDGPKASLATPSHCGSYETEATFTPSSGAEPVSASGSFQITSGPEGAPCPSDPSPLTPGFQAGPVNRQAGAFTPFTMTIGRPDEDQQLKGLTIHLPPGEAAVLAGVTPCSEAQAAASQCGPESLIGHSTAVAGPGSEPVALPGEVYLTGPYRGAPFGILAVTHAEHVGPFDLGDISVRGTITVDHSTAAATITTDPLPRAVKGVPAAIKKLNVLVDRPNFEFNPTGCGTLAITGTIGGWDGATAGVSSPVRAANCAALPFAPKLTAEVGGQASRANGASLTVRISSGGLGAADIHEVDLTLPKALPSREATLRRACRDTVFDVNPAQCEAGSIIGRASVVTPVLRSPLSGPVYLVSHGNAAFPDVELVLEGEGVKLILDGTINIENGITYTKFQSAPDAPFTSFVTELPSGPGSVLGAYVPDSQNYSLCKANLSMPTVIRAYNGALIEQATKIAPIGCQGVATFKATRATRLARALKSCHKIKSRARRHACERTARRRYGAKRAVAKTHHR